MDFELRHHEGVSTTKVVICLKASTTLLVCNIVKCLANYGFQQSYSNYSLFTLQKGATQLNVLVYVDDLIISGSHPEVI